MASQPYKIAFQNDILTVTFKKGTVLPPECIMEVIAEMNQLCDLSQCNALFDGRGTQPSDDLGYDAMERIINYINNNPDFKWNPRLALLVDAGVQYGLSRMFQALVDNFPVEILIFSDEAEAMAWIIDNKALGNPEDKTPG